VTDKNRISFCGPQRPFYRLNDEKFPFKPKLNADHEGAWQARRNQSRCRIQGKKMLGRIGGIGKFWRREPIALRWAGWRQSGADPRYSMELD
jgi:hypothetical protein